jgi:hypothetical protein
MDAELSATALELTRDDSLALPRRLARADVCPRRTNVAALTSAILRETDAPINAVTAIGQIRVTDAAPLCISIPVSVQYGNFGREAAR